MSEPLTIEYVRALRVVRNVENYLENAGDSELVFSHILTMLQQDGFAQRAEKPAPVRDAAESVGSALDDILCAEAGARIEGAGSMTANEAAVAIVAKFADGRAELSALRARVAGLERELADVRHTLDTDALRFIEREGYRRCDIPACNCGSWHGGHMRARFDEIHDLLVEHDVETNGKTLLNAVRGVLEDRDAARALLAVERERVIEECAKVCDARVEELSLGRPSPYHSQPSLEDRRDAQIDGLNDIARQLRALAQPRAERETK